MRLISLALLCLNVVILVTGKVFQNKNDNIHKNEVQEINCFMLIFGYVRVPCSVRNRAPQV